MSMPGYDNAMPGMSINFNPGRRMTMESLYRGIQSGKAKVTVTTGREGERPVVHTGHVVSVSSGYHSNDDFGYGPSVVELQVQFAHAAEYVDIELVKVPIEEDEEMYSAEAVKDRSKDMVTVYVRDEETGEYLNHVGDRVKREMGVEKPVYDTIPVEIAGPIADAIHHELS